MSQAIGRSDELAVVMTGSSASSGYSLTCWRRLLTLSSALLMSVPTTNSSVRRARESMHSPVILRMPSTPLSCSSCSWTISRSTSCGLAPGHSVSIVMVGVCTSGTSCIGMRCSEMVPKSATSRTPTATLIGLRTNEPTSPIAYFPTRIFWPGRSRSLPRTTTFWPGCSGPRTSISPSTAMPSWTGTIWAVPLFSSTT